MTNRQLVAFVIALVAMAFVLGYVAGGRAEAASPEPSVTPTGFRAFEVPDPTLPASCCHADADDYAEPVSPGPAATPAPSQEASRSSRQRRNPNVAHTAERQARRTTRHQLAGKASWHATGRSGLYAAACRPLREAMGPGWRGRRVLVAYGRQAVEVVLNDWCASRDKTIDLSDEAFRYFAPLSRGVIRVTVGW